MDDKVIVSNHAALMAKYGRAGVVKIRKAIAGLIAADAKRGIISRLVYLDSAAAMKKLHGRAVNDRTSARQNKQAIDAIFRATNPEYLMILGAPDVVPHQDMSNPAFDPPDDPDKYAYGDLPYARDVPYSRDVASFKGPTRVVGRLPDLTGAREPAHLLPLLAVAERYQSHDVTDYGKYFGLSTQSWRRASSMCSATLPHSRSHRRKDPGIRRAIWLRSHILSIAMAVRPIRTSTAREASRSRYRSPAMRSRARSSREPWLRSNVVTGPSCTIRLPFPCRCRSANVT
jgi:hypothetical protein